jgi:hypothetical protein
MLLNSFQVFCQRQISRSCWQIPTPPQSLQLAAGVPLGWRDAPARQQRCSVIGLYSRMALGSVHAEHRTFLDPPCPYMRLPSVGPRGCRETPYSAFPIRPSRVIPCCCWGAGWCCRTGTWPARWSCIRPRKTLHDGLQT